MESYIVHGDCLEEMPKMQPDSVDSIVCDPPYGLSFMGKDWDHGVPGPHFWSEALRVVKPGAFMLAFGGTRTFHRLAVAIEDAGWEIRDVIMWVYGSGFPKSHNISKQIDKMNGVDREVVGVRNDGRGASPSKIANHGHGDTGIGHADGSKQVYEETIATSEDAKQWEGWGTALKPAWELIIVARKPIIGTVAANVLKYGTGGMNIDGCRVAVDPSVDDMLRVVDRGERQSIWKEGSGFKNENNKLTGVPLNGRWPANLIHDGSEEVLELFPDSKGQCGDLRAGITKQPYNCYGDYGQTTEMLKRNDSGSAARFFYCAKASRQDRNEGIGDMPEKPLLWSSGTQNPGSFQAAGTKRAAQNNHPTVKPTPLMQYLCRLVTPSNGTILDPFMGSGSTGKAAILEGFNFIGIDLDENYCEIAKRRIEHSKRIIQMQDDKKSGELF